MNMKTSTVLKNFSVVAAGAALSTCILADFKVDAATINIDLSGATTGTLISAPGGSFAQTFSGQTVVGGTGISGNPTNPLTLAPSGSLTVAFWSPGVSPASNSILPQPSNTAPLSLLLDQPATSITWTMGSASPPSSVTIDFFANDGSLVNTVVQNLLTGYNVYTFAGLGGNFKGLTVKDNNDSAGLRYQNFSYETATVPEPASVLGLFALGALGAGSIIKGKLK